MTLRLRRILLAGLASLLAAEGVARYLAHRENARVLEEALAEPAPIPADGVVRLGHLLQLDQNDRVVYVARPGLDGVLYAGAPLSTNGHGFRGREVAHAKPPGVVRIVGLGDSVMFGQGVADDETYLAILEAELNARHPERLSLIHI